MKKAKNPLVVIQCLVYNQEKYIRDCLDGFVMQQTDFPFVAVVHDDASSVEAGSRPGCAYILLPAVEKKDIFETVKKKELFPKKSFSIGNAREKRYYLECRKIR